MYMSSGHRILFPGRLFRRMEKRVWDLRAELSRSYGCHGLDLTVCFRIATAKKNTVPINEPVRILCPPKSN
jgi:hypothetical protein